MSARRWSALARARLCSYPDRAEVRLSDGAVTIGEPDGSFDRYVSNYVLDLLSRESIGQLAVRSPSSSRTGRIALPGQSHPWEFGVSEGGLRRLEPHPRRPAGAGWRMPTDRIAGFRLVTGLASRVPRRGFLLRPEFRGAGGCARLIATQPTARRLSATVRRPSPPSAIAPATRPISTERANPRARTASGRMSKRLTGPKARIENGNTVAKA